MLLAAQLEAADGRRATWRWARNSRTDRVLGLPVLERWADVELRDGVIASLTFRSDPVSRERYSRAVEAVAAQRLPLSAGSTAPHDPTITSAAGPGAMLGRHGAGWAVALAACALTAVAAAVRPRT